MNKEKIVNFIGTVIGLLAAALVFLNWNPENLLKGKEPPVTLEDVEKNLGTDFAGSKAGEDIKRLTGKEDFENNYYQAVTAEPIGIVKTGAYELKSWVDPYIRRRTRKGRVYGAPKRKEQFLQYKNPDGWFQNRADYLPFYLLELSDHTYILVQIPDRDARAIEKGKDVVLPIGKKIIKGIPKTLKSLCEEYDASTDIYYAFEDEWYEKHHFILFLMRVGAAIVVLFAVAVVLIIIGNKVFRTDRASK